MAIQRFELKAGSPEEETAAKAAENDPLIQGIRRQFRANGKGDKPLPYPLEDIRAFFVRLLRNPGRGFE